MTEQVEEESQLSEVQEKPQTPVQREKKEKKRRFNLDTFKTIAEALKWIQRAILGLELEEDKLQGMMNQKDTKERTRISVKGIRRHVFMRTLAKSGVGYVPNPYAILDEVAELEDIYLIAKNGEQRKEYILLKRNEPQPSQVSIGVVPQVETNKSLVQKKQGGHFWNRNKNPVQQNA